MLLWFGFALLTAAAVGALLRPLARSGVRSMAAREADVAIYRDQLAEIEADRQRGLLGSAEAGAARAEVARRLIAAAGEDAGGSGPAEKKSSNGSAVRNAVAVGVPLMAVGLYIALGRPDLPGQPFVDPGAKPIEQASEGELVAMVENRLRDHPEEGKGWDVIGPVYMNQGRFAEAANAYGRAIQLLGESPKRLKGLAEATILANDGMVTEGAREAFERLLALEPANGEAQFGLALAKEQDGKLAEAAADYRRILDAAPKDARWRAALEVRLARLLRGGGPSDVESAAAVGMSKEERDAFILGMVERLAARLKTKGDDLSGWQQLVRSYKVLGREADAGAALTEARKQFKDDPKALAELDSLAKSLGMGS